MGSSNKEGQNETIDPKESRNKQDEVMLPFSSPMPAQMPPLPLLSPKSDVIELHETGPIVSKSYGMIEFERFIAHQDFALFLSLACKVKVIRKNLISGNVPNATDIISISHIESKRGEEEVNEAAKFIQSTLLLGEKPLTINLKNIIIPKGVYDRTDDLIEESIVSLCREFNRCMTWYNAKQNQSLPRPPPRKKIKTNKENGPNQVIVKYSKWQTDILTNWTIENRRHPFPNPSDVEQLSLATNLTKTQIINWTTNIRKRNWKATVEKGKKPHHFLDFLFLADDRDKKLGRYNNGVQPYVGVTERITHMTSDSRSSSKPVAFLTARGKTSNLRKRTKIGTTSTKSKTAVKTKPRAKKGKIPQALKRTAASENPSHQPVQNDVAGKVPRGKILQTLKLAISEAPFYQPVQNGAGENLYAEETSAKKGISHQALKRKVPEDSLYQSAHYVTSQQLSTQVQSYQVRESHTYHPYQAYMIRTWGPNSYSSHLDPCSTPYQGIYQHYVPYQTSHHNYHYKNVQNVPQVTPSRCKDEFEDKVDMVTSKAGNKHFYENEILSQSGRGSLTNNLHEQMDINNNRDFEQEMLDKITQEGLVSTPPRSGEDDSVWGSQLNESDIRLSDIFKLPVVSVKDSSRLSSASMNGEVSIKSDISIKSDPPSVKYLLSNDGMDLSFNTANDERKRSLTEYDIFEMLDDELEICKVEELV